MKASHLRITVADAPAEGEVRLVQLDGHTIGLYRIGDHYHALADRCPHRAAPLASAGRVVRGIALEHGTPTRGTTPGLLRCPWHKWDFDIATGRCLVHPRLRVRRYEVKHDGDDLIITLRHPTAPDNTPKLQSGRPALNPLTTLPPQSTTHPARCP